MDIACRIIFIALISSVSACSKLYISTLPVEFNENYDGFDRDTLIYAAGIATVSYEKSLYQARQSLMNHPSYQMECVDLVDLPDTDRRILLAARGSTLFISMNGSGPFMDWVNNAKYKIYFSDSSEGPYAQLLPGHGGFRTLFSKMRPAVVNAILNSPCRSERITRHYYAGHSLSAALGLHLAYQLCDIEGALCFDGMFLFAPPLTTYAESFAAAARSFNQEKIIGIQNSRDYVARGGYRGALAHPGRFYVLSDGNYEEKPPGEKFVKYSLWDKITFLLFREHRMKAYTKALEAIPSS